MYFVFTHIYLYMFNTNSLCISNLNRIPLDWCLLFDFNIFAQISIHTYIHIHIHLHTTYIHPRPLLCQHFYTLIRIQTRWNKREIILYLQFPLMWAMCQSSMRTKSKSLYEIIMSSYIYPLTDEPVALKLIEFYRCIQFKF